jgi:hypothetical protein
MQFQITRADLDEWKAALTSGKFPQGTKGYLCYKGEYCCLGVRAELAVSQELIEKRSNYRNDGSDTYGDSNKSFPTSLRILHSSPYYGMNIPIDKLPIEVKGRIHPDLLGGTKNVALTAINDSGVPFSTIAEILEQGCTIIDNYQDRNVLRHSLYD